MRRAPSDEFCAFSTDFRPLSAENGTSRPLVSCSMIPLYNKRQTLRSAQSVDKIYFRDSLLLVPAGGLEPPRCFHRLILSQLRVPFRHAGI